MKHLSIIAILLVSLPAWAQETLVPATYNTELLMNKNKEKFRLGTMKSDELLELPFIDDFSSDKFPDNEAGNTPLWMNRYATLNTTTATNPPTIGVVTFDGGDAVGYPYDWNLGSGPADTLTSCPINLTGVAEDNIGLSFYFQPRGAALFGPSNSDSLTLEFYAPELEQWFWAWSTTDISDPENFTFVYLAINQDRYMKEGFQFRFRNYADLQGAADFWHVDYVWLDRNLVNSTPIVNDVAFVRQENTLLHTYTAMPRTHFTADYMREDITVLLRNLNDAPRTLLGNELRILHEGTVVASFPNDNSPAIPAGGLQEYTHAVALPPNSFVYNPNLDDPELIFDVQVVHGVSDFVPTVSNDTMHFKQHFFQHYAYDDGSAEAGYAVFQNGQREAAMRFTSTISDSVYALQIYTMPLNYNYENTSMTVRLYAATPNGPGEILAEALKTVTYGIDEYQQSIIYTFEEPVFVPAGNFFVGYREANQANSIVVGLDLNRNYNDGRLYWRVGTTWNLSGSPGTVMMRPLYGNDLTVNTRNSEFDRALNLYPNPAREYFTISYTENDRLDIRIFDLGGRLLHQQQITGGNQISTSDLAMGIYLVRITHPSGNVATKKLVVNR